MRGAIPPLPRYAFMAWCSVKAQGQLYLLTFTLTVYFVRKMCQLSNVSFS